MAMKPFTETLSYQLAQVCRAHRGRAEALLSEVGLHTGQELMLMRLWQADGCAQSELGDALCVQPATVTKSLDRLEAAGLVQRRADPDDGRISRVYITSAGRALQKKVEGLWQELETTSLGALTREEQETLRRLLATVLERLTA
jgi:DNA-binding MarR family transcriptional regulator